MMKAKLVIVGGDAKKTEIELKLPATVGRGREASLTLPHPLVSRLHCELYDSDGRLFVRDLGSLNGTFVNNERIDGEAELPVGELLTVGTVTFRAEYEAEAELQPPQVGEDAEDAQQPDAAKKTGSDTEKAPAEKAVEVGSSDDAIEKDAATDKVPAAESFDDGLDDEDFDGFDDLDFDEIDELGEDEEFHEQAEQQPEKQPAPAEATVKTAQPLAADGQSTPTVGPLPEPAPPASAAQAVPKAAAPQPTPTAPAQPPSATQPPSAAQPAPTQADTPPKAQPLPNPTPPAQATPSPGPPTPPAGEVPSAKAVGPPDETPQADADDENDDDALNSFLKGLD